MTIYISDTRTTTQAPLEDLVVELTGIVRSDTNAIESITSWRNVDVYGSLYGTVGGINVGVQAHVSIGTTGLVYRGTTAISVQSGSIISNAGLVAAGGRTGTGIVAAGWDNTITNTGTIQAYNGIRVGDGITGTERVVNSGTITTSGGIGILVSGVGDISNSGDILAATGTAVAFSNTFSGRNNLLVNTGTINALMAVTGSALTDVVINKGMIDGWIDLGDGHDSYNGSDGRFNGGVILGNGNDRMIGGADSEQVQPGEGDDIIDGGGGDTDSVQFLTGGNVTVDLRLTGPQQTGEGLDTFINVESVYTNEGADRLTGNDANNGFHGGDGSDTLDGGLGNDTIWGGEGIDTLVFSGSKAATVNLAVVLTAQNTGHGFDVLNQFENVTGGSGADRLTGDGLANVLIGNGGKDRLSSGDGDDTLIGGAADDILAGGAGRDVFVFDGGRDKNVDTISGYVVADDVIHLQNSVYTKIGAPGVLASKAFWTGKKAHDSSDRIIYDKGTGALWYDADGTGKAAQIKIGQLTKNLKMDAAEFFVI